MSKTYCYCGQIIHQDGLVWFHVTSGATRCYPGNGSALGASPRPAASAVLAQRDESQRVHGSEARAADDPVWLPVLVEEVGEVARALNDGEPLAALYAELVQVAAVASAWADAVSLADKKAKGDGS
jgi:hypothetical protein